MKTINIFILTMLCSIGTLNAATHIYNVKNFNALKSSVAVIVNYSQGRHYAMKVEGSEEQLSRLEVVVNDNTLILRDKRKAKAWKGRVNVTLTAPHLNSISNSGTLIFKAKACRDGMFNIKNSGVLQLNITAVNCQQMNVNNSGSAQLMCNVKANGNIMVKNSGSLKVNGNMNSSAAFIQSNSGSMKMMCNAIASQFDSKNSGSLKIEQQIDAATMNMKNSGSCSGTLSYKGRAAVMQNSGHGKLGVTVDCEELSASTSGMFQMSIKGTADKTNIKSTGISKIDVSQLNK